MPKLRLTKEKRECGDDEGTSEGGKGSKKERATTEEEDGEKRGTLVKRPGDDQQGRTYTAIIPGFAAAPLSAARAL